MNIIVSIHLLLSAFISICSTARLTDDQLAQILTDKLSAGPMTDSREYPSVEDINEFDRRLAALEKLDDVTDRLFDDDTQEEYGDAPHFGSDNMLDNVELTGKVLPIESAFDDALTGLTDTVNDLDGSFLQVEDVDFDGTMEGRQDFQKIFNDCSQNSFTLEEFEDCLKVEQLRNEANTIYETRQKKNPFCSNRYNCFKRRIQKENEKRNPFCGRRGCRNRFSRRLSCKGPKCRRIRKARQAAETLLMKMKSPVKTRFACNRGGCSSGKRDTMFRSLNDAFTKLTNRHTEEKKAVGQSTGLAQPAFQPPSGAFAAPQTNPVKASEETGTRSKLTGKDKEDTRRIPGFMCINTPHKCMSVTKKRKLKRKKLKSITK